MKTTILFLFVFISSTLTAQIISGTVVDTENNPLPGANVYIENTFNGTSSDANGNFSFQFSDTGTFNLMVEFIGYETIKKEILLTGKSFALNITLKEEFNQLKAVVITAGTYGSGKSETAVVMSSLDVVTTAGSMGDINAAMRSLPGTSTNGESGKLFVHGGEGTETGTYIDGIYVHQPYTTSAPNMAVRGRFNPFMFSGTSFSTGGYSAEYGQALSSVLTLNTNDMPDEESMDISLMTIGADLAGTKMWKTGAITVSGNYLNLKPYMKLIPQNYDWNQEPEAYGGSLSFRQKTKGSGMFKIYGSFDESNLSQYQLNPDGSGNNTNVDVTNNNQFVNANWHGSLSEKWFVTMGGSYTHNNDRFAREFTVLNQKLEGNHIKGTVKYELTEKIRFRGGIENFYTNFSNNYSLINQPGDSISSYTENLSAGFFEAQVYTSSNFLMNIGLRGEHSQYLNQNTLSPRVSLAYKLGEKSSLSAAYGWFYQNPLNEQLLHRNYLTNERAQHYVLSYNKQMVKRTFRAEAYFKKYDGLVKYGNNLSSTFSNTGSGFAYGLDVYFKDDKTIKNGSYWISYSFLQTERDFRYYPEMAVPSFAVTHSVSVVYKHWINKWRSYIGASFRYGSPRVYNDLNSPEFNKATLPSYATLDVNWSFLYRQNIIFFASATNVLGFDQVFGYQYSPIKDGNGQFPSTPIVPAAKRFFFVGCFITLTKSGESNQIDKIGF